MKYRYTALNKKGRQVAGMVEAKSVESANEKLMDLGYIPSEVDPVVDKSRGLSFSGLMRPLKNREIIIFTKQFRTMNRTGVPMLELLKVLEMQTEHPRLRSVIIDIAKNVREGMSLPDAFRRHPKIFSRLYCSVLQAGERSGALSKVLDRLTVIMEHEEKIKSDIRAALLYPAYVIGFLGVAFFILLIFVIPKFVKVFKSKGVELPLPTRACIFLYDNVSAYWHLWLLLTLAVGFGLYGYFRTENGKYVRDSIFIRLPIMGQLFVKAAMSRFSSMFSILQYSGVSMIESMRILSGTIGNRAISREFDEMKGAIRQGSSIAMALKSSRHFPPMVINLVAIGEKTESLAEMLSEISEHYDAEVDYAMRGVTDSIVPVLTICIAVVAGFFALAIFLPMWDMARVVQIR